MKLGILPLKLSCCCLTIVFAFLKLLTDKAVNLFFKCNYWTHIFLEHCKSKCFNKVVQFHELSTVFWSLCEGSNEVLWRHPGKDVTIQCRPDTEDKVLSLSVKMGLTDYDVFRVEDSEKEPLIKSHLQERIQSNGKFPNLDILIKNLLLNDTGPYWCVYKRIDHVKRETETFKGKGAVLLVVSGKPYSISVVIIAFSPIRQILPLRTLLNKSWSIRTNVIWASVPSVGGSW